MTEAMPFLQKAILLSYDPRPFGRGVFAIVEIHLRMYRIISPGEPDSGSRCHRNGCSLFTVRRFLCKGAICSIDIHVLFLAICIRSFKFV